MGVYFIQPNPERKLTPAEAQLDAMTAQIRAMEEQLLAIVTSIGAIRREIAEIRKGDEPGRRQYGTSYVKLPTTTAGDAAR